MLPSQNSLLEDVLQISALPMAKNNEFRVDEVTFKEHDHAIRFLYFEITNHYGELCQCCIDHNDLDYIEPFLRPGQEIALICLNGKIVRVENSKVGESN